MRNIIFTLLCLVLSAQIAQSQTYTVLKVEPKNGIKADGKTLSVGNKLKADAQIIVSENACLRVFDGKSSATINQSGKLKDILKSPRTVSEAEIAGTKAVISTPEDLANLFNKRPLLIIDSMQITVPKSMFVLKPWTEDPEGQFCFVSYLYEGIPLNKFLKSTENNGFILDENIFSFGGEKVDLAKVDVLQLHYAVDAYTDKILVRDLHLSFINTSEIKEEIAALIASSPQKSGESLLDPVMIYLIQHYGTPDRTHLKDWLEREF